MENLETIFYLSWDKNTCKKKYKSQWNDEKPYIGQSDVTSLIVNDLLGGDIRKVKHNNTSHYFNVVDGEILDYTKTDIINYSESKLINRKKLLDNSDTLFRYYILLKNVKYNMELFNDKKYKKETKILEIKLNEETN